MFWYFGEFYCLTKCIVSYFLGKYYLDANEKFVNCVIIVIVYNFCKSLFKINLGTLRLFILYCTLLASFLPDCHINFSLVEPIEFCRIFL